MGMGFCFRKFPILACSLSLFISSGVSFANPGDYLVSPLDAEKDKNLKCCCCGYNLLGSSLKRKNLPVFYIKYNEGDDIKGAIASAREFNTGGRPESLRATLFKKIKDIITEVRVNGPKATSKSLKRAVVSDLTTTQKVAEAFRNFIGDLNGLFCLECISRSMYALDINTFHEFLSFKPRAYAEDCTMCFKKIIPYIGAKFCNRCHYCRVCEGCKLLWSTCTICKVRCSDPNCYLFDKAIHRYSDRDNGRFEVYLNSGLEYSMEMGLEEENVGRLMIAFCLRAGSNKFVIESYTLNSGDLHTSFNTDGKIELLRRMVLTGPA